MKKLLSQSVPDGGSGYVRFSGKTAKTVCGAYYDDIFRRLGELRAADVSDDGSMSISRGRIDDLLQIVEDDLREMRLDIEVKLAEVDAARSARVAKRCSIVSCVVSAFSLIVSVVAVALSMAR